MEFGDDSLSCPVCLTVFNDPRVLPCGHSFCLKCLLATAGNSKIFPCPTCRDAVNLKGGTADELPRNFSLRHLIELNKKIPICSEHNKLTDIFCKQCNVVICSKCLPILHEGHGIGDIDDLYKNKKDNLIQFLATTKLWHSKAKEKEEAIKLSRVSTKINVDDAQGMVADMFKKWYDALHTQETAILSYVAQETEKRMKVSDEAEKILQISMTCVADLEKDINKILRQDMSYVIQEYETVKTRYEVDGNKVLQDLQTCFVPPKELKIHIHAPWIDEAIINIKAFDEMTITANSSTRKVSDIIEENGVLNRKCEFIRGEKDDLEKTIADLKKSLTKKEDNISGLQAEIKMLQTCRENELEKYQKETFVLKLDHQEETEKLKEEIITLNERFKRELEEYEKEKLGLTCRYQEEIRGLNEEIKRHNERQLRIGGEFNKRQKFTSTSDDHRREDRSDPLDLDTAYIYLNATNLQRNCKQLDNLRQEIERKQKKKAQKEKKKKCLLLDSKAFKQTKEAYRELYKEILVQRIAVDNLFDASRCPPDDNKDDQEGCTGSRWSIASEIQRPNLRPHFPQLKKEQCDKCLEKSTHIWNLEANIDKAKCDVRDIQQRINELEAQIGKERSEKEDALRRLSDMASAKPSENNPNIADFSDPNRPTKIAEKLSEIYDNEWTDAFDHLENYYSKNEEDNIRLLLNVLVEVHQQCNNLSGQILTNIIAPMKPTEIPSAISKNLKDAVKALAPYRMPAIAKDIKSNLNSRFKSQPGDPFDIYVDKCVDVCLYMSVQDPPMYLSADPSKDGLFSQASYRAYTKSGKYERFIVWPVLYLHKNGPMMVKGVAQGTDDYTMITNNYTQKYYQPVQSQYVPRRQNDYQHRPHQHQQQDWNQYHGMQTPYGPQANLRHSQYPSSYRGQGYSKHQFNKTYNPRISSQTTDL